VLGASIAAGAIALAIIIVLLGGGLASLRDLTSEAFFEGLRAPFRNVAAAVFPSRHNPGETTDAFCRMGDPGTFTVANLSLPQVCTIGDPGTLDLAALLATGLDDISPSFGLPRQLGDAGASGTPELAGGPTPTDDEPPPDFEPLAPTAGGPSTAPPIRTASKQPSTNNSQDPPPNFPGKSLFPSITGIFPQSFEPTTITPTSDIVPPSEIDPLSFNPLGPLNPPQHDGPTTDPQNDPVAVPEPSSLAILAVSLVLLRVRQRARRDPPERKN
jgi:hypothetical protein